MPIKGNLVGKFEKELRHMAVGEDGYTLPWALSLDPVDDGLIALLNTHYPVKPQPKGTATLYVKKVGPKINDFEVDLDSAGDYKWHFGRGCYTGTPEDAIVNIGKLAYPSQCAAIVDKERPARRSGKDIIFL